MKNKKQSGFTLLELLLVVGVGALLIIGGISTYRIVVEGNRVNESTRMIMTIKQETQKLYQGQNSYNGLTTAILQNAHAIPQNLMTPFNSTITVAPAAVNAVANAGFTVTFPNIPSSACMRLAKAFTDPSDVEQIVIGTVTVTHANLLDQNYAWITNVTTGCGTDSFASIAWTFR